MQTLLNEIELDIQELKCLMQAITTDANPALRIVAKRSIQQMKIRLDALQMSLENNSATVSLPEEETIAPPLKELQEETLPVKEEPKIPQETPLVLQEAPVAPLNSTILAERIKPAGDLRHAISLNDSFRFTREIFHGDSLRMNEIVHRLGEASSLNAAMAILSSEVHMDEDNEALVDLVELLKKYFS